MFFFSLKYHSERFWIVIGFSSNNQFSCPIKCFCNNSKGVLNILFNNFFLFDSLFRNKMFQMFLEFLLPLDHLYPYAPGSRFMDVSVQEIR